VNLLFLWDKLRKLNVYLLLHCAFHVIFSQVSFKISTKVWETGRLRFHATFVFCGNVICNVQAFKAQRAVAIESYARRSKRGREHNAIKEWKKRLSWCRSFSYSLSEPEQYIETVLHWRQWSLLTYLSNCLNPEISTE